MRVRVALLWGAALAPALCLAQGQTVQESPTILSEVLVTGEYPGPGLWKLTRPESDHVLWIAGEPPLLPPGIRWRSKAVEEVAAHSQLIVMNGSFTIGVDRSVGVLRMLSVAPSLMGARKNPEGQRLQDLLPADLYARWLVQKARVLGRDRSIEKWRPHFAADELRSEAVKLYQDGSATTFPAAGLWSTLRRIAKERGIKVIAPSVSVMIPAADLRAAVKRFKRHSLDDAECFADTVAYVEALTDVEQTNARARAWAIGDLTTLRQLTPLPDYQTACDAALAQSEAAEPYDVGDMAVRLETLWLNQVEASFIAHPSTLALLPIEELMRGEGRLSQLQARGFVIEEPQ